MKINKTIEWNGQKTSLLSWTTDMAAWSFSLPAGSSCPGMVANNENDICHSCYAQLNRYNMPNVLTAQWIRFNWIRENLKTADGRKIIVDTLVGAIKSHVENGYFRVHDSGDLFNSKYIACWIQICKSLPDIQFWFPTRSYTLTNLLPDLKELAELPNVTVRPSALKFNEPSPSIVGLSHGTTVITNEELKKLHNVCPKTQNKGTTCESNACRSCWEDEKDIAYFVHGWQGRKKVADAFTPKVVATRKKIADKFIKLTVTAKK